MALPAHDGDGVLHSEEHPYEVHPQHSVEFLYSILFDWRHLAENSSIVVEPVQPTECVQGEVKGLAHLRLIGDVRGERPKPVSLEARQ